MIYNTGTITINGNTATGTGTNWTAPASQVRAGQTIIILSNPVQMFQISSVNNATSLTVTPAASPALNGQKYGILVSDIISVDGLAQAMSQLIKEYDENIGAWETFATTSANQSITVTINGTAVTIPAIGKLLQKGSNGALGIAEGGTGATTKEDGRTNLGAAGSGDNSDITSLSAVIPPRGAINSRLNGGASSVIALGAAAGTAVKPFNLNVSRLGNASNNWNFQVTYGFLVGDDGSANASGPILVCCDGSSYERRWIFRNADGAINTSNGTISPVASDERVKNIVREISEEEAVEFINGLKPIRYAFKWSPGQIRVGYSAQNVELLDPELIETSALTVTDPDDYTKSTVFEDGKIIDPGEIGAAYLVPVVKQLLRRVEALENLLNQQVAQQ
ncbi:TPA: tail fiber domain-containing protein [Escherichia coli]|nr:tail fiber domain-containing protein [Escherichia coli]HCJ8723889.1 tail fiber domain-containing protein [Escherichia coli]